MPDRKVFISLPEASLRSIEGYRTDREGGSRPFGERLSLSWQQELESAYRESSLEIDGTWDVTIADGLALE